MHQHEHFTSPSSSGSISLGHLTPVRVLASLILLTHHAGGDRLAGESGALGHSLGSSYPMNLLAKLGPK